MDDSERSWLAWRPWRSAPDGEATDRTTTDRTPGRDDATAVRTGEEQSEPAAERRTVLVTGCDAPVGRATARRFEAAGWRVYAAGRDREALASLADAGCETAELDVTADANVAGVVRRVLGETDRLDCLVTGPGAGPLGPVEDVPTDAVEDGLDATVLGPHRLARRVLPHMRDRGGGTVVTVASALGRVGVPGAAGVCAPAAALATATEALRAEVAPFGVDVVLVETGPVRGADGDRRGADARAVSGSRDESAGGARSDATGGPAATASDGGTGATRTTGTAGEAEGDGTGRTEAYASLYDALDDARVVGPAVGTVAPERVAATVLNAASCTDPAPRYGVGRAVRVARVAGLVPPRWRDRAFGLLRRLP